MVLSTVQFRTGLVNFQEFMPLMIIIALSNIFPPNLCTILYKTIVMLSTMLITSHFLFKSSFSHCTENRPILHTYNHIWYLYTFHYMIKNNTIQNPQQFYINKIANSLCHTRQKYKQFFNTLCSFWHSGISQQQ